MLLLNKLSSFGVCIVLISSISAFQPQANLTTATCENFHLLSDNFARHHQFKFTETSSDKLSVRNPANMSANYLSAIAAKLRLNTLAILNQNSKNNPLSILPIEVADLNFRHKRGSFRKTLAPRRYYTQSSFGSIPLADQIHATCDKHVSDYFKEKSKHTELISLQI
ncbi:MAG: hypothetical protein M1495_15550 [Bacteroidetes bacterium]|nr:hypothetical protein [Bacteroidota bacterium]